MLQKYFLHDFDIFFLFVYRCHLTNKEMVWFVIWIKLCERSFLFFFLFSSVKIRKELSNFCKTEKKKIYLLQSLENCWKILLWWTPRSKHRVGFVDILINLINVAKIELCCTLLKIKVRKEEVLGFFLFQSLLKML